MPAKSYSIYQPLLLLFLAVALSACNPNTNEPNVATGVTAVSGSDQYAVTGSQAANPLVVLVFDQNGSPFPGDTVKWKVTGGGGSVADSMSVSDATGHASMTYTAGPTAGRATVVAIVSQIFTADFTIHVVTP